MVALNHTAVLDNRHLRVHPAAIHDGRPVFADRDRAIVADHRVGDGDLTRVVAEVVDSDAVGGARLPRSC